MKERLQRILSVVCVLALVLGCMTVPALSDGNTKIVTIIWNDSNNTEGVRPDSVTVGGVALNEGNGWTGVIETEDGSVTVPAVAGYDKSESGDDIIKVTYTHALRTTNVQGSVNWEDNKNAKQVRPGTLSLQLLADGVPCRPSAKVGESNSWAATWDKVPMFKYGTNDQVTYTIALVSKPAGYTVSGEGQGKEITCTLQTGTLQVKGEYIDVPEGSDTSGLQVRIDGPDPDMPATLSYGEVTGGKTFSNVLPGTYLLEDVNADTLAEGYFLVGGSGKVADAVQLTAGGTAELSFKFVYGIPEGVAPEDLPDPTASEGNLTFEILGPDGFNQTVHYSEFTGGTYTLDNLAPGSYTVVERNAENLVDCFSLRSDSVTGMHLMVTAEGTATAKLYNHYTPAPTPVPDAEFVDIPVTKTWNDSNDKDGNRPDSITVRLYADGVEVDSHILTAAENWKYTFIEKPRYQEDMKTEIVYTVNEDNVAMYAKDINGYNIVNDYRPQVTSVSVSKVWDDNGNAQRIRPSSIGMTLSDGQKTVTTVILSEANGWYATVNNLPTIVNGQAAVYTWKEQPVLGYKEGTVSVKGDVTVFTNTIWKRPDTPTQGKKPKTPGEVVNIEEYETPLGVEIIINHVGDCFD